ncbi:hypothetical protein C8R47DRAFT_1215346 [Mycena vitilis]|nr:hypothetical protein C8R47DRAFT_1215346 [Mycena vitilis]
MSHEQDPRLLAFSVAVRQLLGDASLIVACNARLVSDCVSPVSGFLDLLHALHVLLARSVVLIRTLTFSTTPNTSITRYVLNSTLLDPFFALGDHVAEALLLLLSRHLSPPAPLHRMSRFPILSFLCLPTDPPYLHPPCVPLFIFILNHPTIFYLDDAASSRQLSPPLSPPAPPAPSGPIVPDTAPLPPTPPPYFGVLSSGLPDIEAILTSCDLSAIDRETLSRLTSPYIANVTSSELTLSLSLA